METLRTVTVDFDNLSRIEAAIGDANRRIARFNKRNNAQVAEYAISVLRTFTINRRDSELEDAYEVVRAEIALTGEAPRLNDWSILAVAEDTTEGRCVSRTVPGFDVVAFVGDRALRCDHCGFVRNRSLAYVLAKGDEHRLVGSTCVKDFTGHASPEAVVFSADVLSGIAEMLEDEGESFGEGHARNAWSLRTVLAYTYLVVGNSGWVSRREVFGSNRASTSDIVLTLLAARPGSSEYKIRPTAEHFAAADAALDLISDVLAADSTSDYLANLALVVNQGVVTRRNIGIACSIYAAATRAQRDRALAESMKPEHFGTVGKREEFVVTVIAKRTTEGQYGLTTIVSLRDPEGRPAVWFASGSPDLTVGETYRVKATVKAHNVFRDAPQTALTRVAVVKAR